MAAHLEAVPGARAVVNFAPILLEQLEDYIRHIDLPREEPLFATRCWQQYWPNPPCPATPQARLRLVRDCLRANRSA
ncbi:MAG: hypothetical protein R3E50_02035 [Halioglobus sp.]